MINNVAVNIIRQLGFQAFLYLDDRMFITKPKNEEQAQRLMKGEEVQTGPFLGMLLMMGLETYINRPKSELIPTRRMEFLGFIYDSEKCTIGIPERKFTKFNEEAGELVKRIRIPMKRLEKLRGKMVSFSLVATNMRLYIRRITFALKGKQEGDFIELNPGVKEELSVG